MILINVFVVRHEAQEFQFEAQDDYVPESNAETQFLKLTKG